MNNSYNKFLQDLNTGHQFEEKARKRIIKHYHNEFNVVEICNDFKYDFRLSNGKCYEVKYDKSSMKTGNIFIEFISFTKSSGIDKTQADYYIIITPLNEIENIYLLIGVDVIKQMITDTADVRIYKDKYKSGFLFKKDLLINNGIIF